jgi:uncharacterized Zn finger protein
MGYYDWGWSPYVPVAERRLKAQKEMEKRRKAGHDISPVVIEGRAIARTFWGKSWCENLERYSDYANRLPRGRTYVRNGSVVDLQIAAGVIHAHVSGSELYEVELKIAPVPQTRWAAICRDCAGEIGSLVELLQGKLSQGVMERVCRQTQGLFPAPSEIKISCSCPDWASMCKHVAAVMYGVGARLDRKPELLFRLRAVDEKELIAHASRTAPLSAQTPLSSKVLADEDLSAVFGLEIERDEAPKAKPAKTKRVPAKAAVKKTIAKKAPAKKVAAKKAGIRKAAAPKAKRKAATKRPAPAAPAKPPAAARKAPSRKKPK